MGREQCVSSNVQYDDSCNSMRDFMIENGHAHTQNYCVCNHLTDNYHHSILHESIDNQS